jgi:hypothetical protein
MKLSKNAARNRDKRLASSISSLGMSRTVPSGAYGFVLT